VELRSATAGAASYTARFDHLAELSGRAAEQVVSARQAEKAH
jgi:elongation factor G